jgi:ribosomal protein S18 acetylase RimI-like enzyme
MLSGHSNIRIILVFFMAFVAIHPSYVDSYKTQTLTTPDFVLEMAGPSAIYEASQMIAIEKYTSMFPGCLPTEIFSSPVFNLIYLQEVTRLKNNYTKDPTQHQLIVAKSAESEDIVGYIDVDRRNVFERRFPTPYISDVIVRRDWRYRGIGRQLLERCCRVCRDEWDEPFVHLYVETDNSEALRLYEKMSFVPIRGEKGPVEDPSRIRVTALESDPIGNMQFESFTKRFDRLLLRKVLL